MPVFGEMLSHPGQIVVVKHKVSKLMGCIPGTQAVKGYVGRAIISEFFIQPFLKGRQGLLFNAINITGIMGGVALGVIFKEMIVIGGYDDGIGLGDRGDPAAEIHQRGVVVAEFENGINFLEGHPDNEPETQDGGTLDNHAVGICKISQYISFSNDQGDGCDDEKSRGCGV